LISSVVDSGAIDTVLPKDSAKHVPVRQAEMSRKGMYYTTADGFPVYNEGERIIEGFSDQGTPVRTPMQVADVSKPLMSVRRMKQAGNLVVFGLSEGLAIIDVKTGAKLCEGVKT